ncbi:uncharacterized protein LOC131318922 [Rhododendron vialii]|uniref:uncharacterized protein LOC131318922 n=1 Tax=Rhododendron vialii TaxID=182163 RepID=UPI00265FA271|nr:uncharacterized protein LOC131318922 [Rhododendron vialii]
MVRENSVCGCVCGFAAGASRSIIPVVLAVEGGHTRSDSVPLGLKSFSLCPVYLLLFSCAHGGNRFVDRSHFVGRLRFVDGVNKFVDVILSFNFSCACNGSEYGGVGFLLFYVIVVYFFRQLAKSVGVVT